MFASLFVLASTPFKTCVSADHMHLSDLTLSPDPPVHGEHVSLKITSTPDIAITAGTVTVAVTVFGIPVPGAPTYDLCTEVGFRCPLAPAKPVAASVDYRVSPHVPPGIDATISLQIKDGDGAEIGCASFDVKVGGAEGGGLPGGGKHAEARQLGAREQQGQPPVESSQQQPPQPQAQQAQQAQPAQQQQQRAQAQPAQPQQQVEAVSALAKLLAAPAPSAPAPTAEQHKALLAQAYAEQPAWAALFAAWRRQQACLPPRGSSVAPPVPQARPAAEP